MKQDNIVVTTLGYFQALEKPLARASRELLQTLYVLITVQSFLPLVDLTAKTAIIEVDLSKVDEKFKS